MVPDPAQLLADNAALRQLVAEQAARLHAQEEALRAKDAALGAALEGIKSKALEIEKLTLQLAKLRRMQFGQSSEKLGRSIAQLELALEDLEAAEGEQAAATEPDAPPADADTRRRPKRTLPPDHLPREERVHEPDSGTCTCAQCGGVLRRLGEDRARQLEYVPAHFKVVEHVRPKFSCRRCEAIIQAPAALPIERGLFGPGLLAHLLVSKFDDHLPLYRQAEIFARLGLELSRSTLADQVGHAVRLLRPLIQAIETSVTGSAKLHADDTPVPVLSPGAGRTRTGYLWVYLRDDRPWNGSSPPAALYRYSPGRGGEHPCGHLKDFQGGAAGRRLCRLQRPVRAGPRRAGPHSRGRLHGARPSQIPRCGGFGQRQGADRGRGAAADRRAVCGGSQDRRAGCRRAPTRAPSRGRPEAGRVEGVVGGHAGPARR
jgi:transposase